VQEALQCYMESLDVKLKVLGPQHSDVANTIENIGVIFAQQGKHDLALDKFSEALGPLSLSPPPPISPPFTFAPSLARSPFGVNDRGVGWQRFGVRRWAPTTWT